MRVCVQCDATFPAGWRCPACAYTPDEVDGRLQFAPNFESGVGGFDPEAFDRLAEVEGDHFWFESRNQLIAWAIARYFPDASSLLETGCGTGFVLAGIERAFPNLTLWGGEPYADGLAQAARRTRCATLVQMDARQIPFEGEFDVVGAFDVLEHIEEDELVLERMHRAVVPGGGIVLTVPQHAFLWSAVDEKAHHVRRYSAPDLATKIRRAGFQVARVTSFMSIMLPLMVLSRMRTRARLRADDGLAELRIGGVANASAACVLSLERLLIRSGISFPAGGSLLAVARKGHS